MPAKEEINHKDYLAKVKKLDKVVLEYIIKDATAARNAMPEGYKAGYYEDEIHYCNAELKRRRDTNKETPNDQIKRLQAEVKALQAANKLLATSQYKP